MQDEGVAPQDVQMSRFLDMSYVGQSFELIVPYIPNFIDEFHRRHDMRYGYEDSTRPTQVVNVRIRVVGPSGTSYRPTREWDQGEEAHAAQVDTIAMYSAGQWCQAPVYDRQRLHAGNRLAGPALITEYSATTVVPVDFVARVDPQHNLILRLGSSSSGRG
jgi:N-methylhydantoinase A